MKNHQLLKIIFAFIVCCGLASCKALTPKTYTNFSTRGFVQNDADERLQGIAIVTEVEGFSKIDTVYTNATGEFYSRMQKVPYPIPRVTITAIDLNGEYLQQSVSPHYMYDCGVGFVPEKDCAFTEDIIFTLLNPIRCK